MTVPPLIRNAVPQLESATLARAETAASELARFDAQLGERVKNFAPVLLRSEAASSSQIENLTASARNIFSADLGLNRGRNAKDIAANTRAMEAALQLASKIDETSIRTMHQVLLEDHPEHTPGSWRQEPVWIGRSASSPVGADYVAPAHERIPDLIDDLTAFAARTDLPVLVSVALAHAQFETIHPFSDGNGRAGRAFAQAMLRNRGVTQNVSIPVSAGLLAEVDGYYAALTEYRAGDPTPIVEAFAQATLDAIENTRQLVAEIDAIRVSWEDRLTVRRNSNAWRLLDIITEQPVLTAAKTAELLGSKMPNVYPPLKALVDAGILQSKHEHNMGPFWRSDEVLHAIDRFAERAGRRTTAR
ncbi:Fic family protein [Micrococcoides hystricis]|uniref:Fic family protein n=1 Tax=Micrococcoides hystricis TaxID=1572761 RepID=A0ABV6P7W5_9MICC